MNSEQLLKFIVNNLDQDKAEDIISIPLAGKSDIADYLVVVSGRSTRHVAAIAENLAKALKDEGLGGVAIEGKTVGDWVLLDAGDVIVHIFRPEIRDIYKIEKIWDF